MTEPDNDAGPGPAAHIVALVVGIPTVAVMLYLVVDQFFGTFTLALAAMAALGCIFAVVGMRSRPRRFQVPALLLTLVPGGIIVAALGVFALIMAAFVAFGGGTA